MHPHGLLSINPSRQWTGMCHEWLYRARCTCGWSTLANTEQLADVTISEHVRVRNAALEFSRR